MIIERVINNNIVSSKDHKGREVVVMGRGIGFQAKYQSEIPEDCIEKVFRIDNQDLGNRFQELIQNMPLKHLQISDDVIAYAKKNLSVKLNQSIYLTLTDHINFAIERYNQGIKLSNPLLWEIKQFYHQEFLIGQYAVHKLNKELKIHLKEDEAGFIALHFVNAEYDMSVNEAMRSATLVQKAIEIVREEFGIELDEGSLHYERFVTHLKFLAQRVFKKQLLPDEEDTLTEMIQKKYQREYECSEKIANFIKSECGVQVLGEEMMYLTIHIRRVTMGIKEE